MGSRSAKPVCTTSCHKLLIASAPGATGNTDSSFAEVVESPGANSVTSCPRSARPSASSETTHSIPPYPFGGTASHGGAICAIRTGHLALAVPAAAGSFVCRRQPSDGRGAGATG